MKPTVSICMPVYNMAGYLPQAIESALAQTYPDFEVLIADNASTDGTFEIAMQYARRDARVRVVRNDTNIGPFLNFNNCFDLARGTWLKFLCGDDWLAADCIEHMMAAVRPGPLVINCTEQYIFSGADGSGRAEASRDVLVRTLGQTLSPLSGSDSHHRRGVRRPRRRRPDPKLHQRLLRDDSS